MPSVLLIALSIASCVAAPPKAPAPAAAPPVGAGLIDAQVEPSNGMVRMTDRATGVVLLSPAGHAIWQPDEGQARTAGPGPSAVEIIPQPGGFDAVVRLTNSGLTPMDPGRIAISGFRFGKTIVSRDFRFDGKEVALQHLNRPFAPGGHFYPDGLYSPVAVMGEGIHRVGASIHYPILEYKHQVRIGVFARREVGGRGMVWEFSFNLNAPGDDGAKLSEAGNIPPGETRTYTVCVRAVNDPAQWEKTLKPYAEFFKEKYGGVRYQRDPRPVQAISAASSGQIAPGNPLGFRQEKLRPDLHGYGPLADHIARYVQLGWKRSMLWAAAGAAEKGQEKNVPWKFSWQWNSGPGSPPRMRDFTTALPRVNQAGGELGLWWSRSARIAVSYDPPTFIDLDPTNPEHVQKAFADLDAAVAAGARTIGLDAFRNMDVWLAYDWMQRLQERAPGVKFVVEPPLGDIMHTLAPCFLLATRAGEGALRIETRHYLADMLLPGHETWGYTRLDRLADYLKREATAVDVAAEMQRAAGLGYVPVASTGAAVDARLIAVESWKTLPPPAVDHLADVPASKPAPRKKGKQAPAENDSGFE